MQGKDKLLSILWTIYFIDVSFSFFGVMHDNFNVWGLDAATTIIGDPVSEVGGSGVDSGIEIISTWWVGPGGNANHSEIILSMVSADKGAATVTLKNWLYWLFDNWLLMLNNYCKPNWILSNSSGTSVSWTPFSTSDLGSKW